MTRRRRTGGWRWLGVMGWVLVSPVLIVLILMALPIVGLLHEREDRLKRALVLTWPCGWCGVSLGADALARADALSTARAAWFQAEHGMGFLRMVRDLDACCPRCNAGHRFRMKPPRLELHHPREFAGRYGALLADLAPATGDAVWPGAVETVDRSATVTLPTLLPKRRWHDPERDGA